MLNCFADNRASHIIGGICAHGGVNRLQPERQQVQVTKLNRARLAVSAPRVNTKWVSGDLQANSFTRCRRVQRQREREQGK